MVRVGGGFATVDDHIKQVGPFECIKIYKIMKGDKTSQPMTFKDAVVFYLKRCKAPLKIVKDWEQSEEGNE